MVVLLQIAIMSVERERAPRRGIKASAELFQIAARIGVAAEIVQGESACRRLLFDLSDALLLQTGPGKEGGERNFGVAQINPFFDRGLIEIGMRRHEKGWPWQA